MSLRFGAHERGGGSGFHREIDVSYYSLFGSLSKSGVGSTTMPARPIWRRRNVIVLVRLQLPAALCWLSTLLTAAYIFFRSVMEPLLTL